MKSRWIAPVLLVAMWAFALVVYLRHPASVPLHYDLRGNVDHWGAPVAAFLLPAIATALVLLARFAPGVSPERGHWERYREALGLMVSAIVAFLGWMEAVTLGTALGWRVDVSRAAVMGMGLMLVVTGNYLPRLRPNWWIGIRTPWTMLNERVWRDTHRLAGWTVVGAGVVAVLSGVFLPMPRLVVVAVAAVLAGTVVPAAYSYVLWRREAKGRA
jgi:uncharacterized membrane protein